MLLPGCNHIFQESPAPPSASHAILTAQSSFETSFSDYDRRIFCNAIMRCCAIDLLPPAIFQVTFWISWFRLFQNFTCGHFRWIWLGKDCMSHIWYKEWICYSLELYQDLLEACSILGLIDCKFNFLLLFLIFIS